MVNRKLIRPSLSDMPSSVSKFQAPGRKRVPPEQTHAENFYYVKQMNNKTSMILRLSNGEELRGYIEWYDRDCIKLNREQGPNLLVYKSSIVYMYKQDEMAGDEGDESSGRRHFRRKREDEDSPDDIPSL
jgi:host factor-I protein